MIGNLAYDARRGVSITLRQIYKAFSAFSGVACVSFFYICEAPRDTGIIPSERDVS